MEFPSNKLPIKQGSILDKIKLFDKPKVENDPKKLSPVNTKTSPIKTIPSNNTSTNNKDKIQPIEKPKKNEQKPDQKLPENTNNNNSTSSYIKFGKSSTIKTSYETKVETKIEPPQEIKKTEQVIPSHLNKSNTVIVEESDSKRRLSQKFMDEFPKEGIVAQRKSQIWRKDDNKTGSPDKSKDFRSKFTEKKLISKVSIFNEMKPFNVIIQTLKAEEFSIAKIEKVSSQVVSEQKNEEVIIKHIEEQHIQQEPTQAVEEKVQTNNEPQIPVQVQNEKKKATNLFADDSSHSDSDEDNDDDS